MLTFSYATSALDEYRMDYGFFIWKWFMSSSKFKTDWRFILEKIFNNRKASFIFVIDFLWTEFWKFFVFFFIYFIKH